MMLTKNIRHIVGILTVLMASVLLYGCAQTGVNDAPSSQIKNHPSLASSFSVTFTNNTSGQVNNVHVFHGNGNDFYAVVGWTGQYTYSFDDQITAISVAGTYIQNNATTNVTLDDGRRVAVSRDGNIVVIDMLEAY